MSTSKFAVHADKVNFKRTKFEVGVSAPLKVGDVIKFKYGVNDLSYMIGKITQIYPNGVTAITECGFYNPAWARIASVWVPKNILNFKHTRVNVEKHSEILPLLDGVLDTIKSKFHLYADNITDERMDCSTKFRRELKFRKGHKWIAVSIPDENAEKLTTVECLNKKEETHKFRVDKDHKTAVNKVIKDIGKLFGVTEERETVDEDAKVSKVKKEVDPNKPKRTGPVKQSGCKLVVYLEWKKGNTDIIKLDKLRDADTSPNTLKMWLYHWKNGRNMPKEV